MIDFDLDLQNFILTVRPSGPLSKQDFALVAKRIDAIIEKKGELPGLIIYARSFPGWKSIAAMVSHFRLVREHHHFIHKVAVVSDAALFSTFPRYAARFISAELKHFDYKDYDSAVVWIEGPEALFE